MKILLVLLGFQSAVFAQTTLYSENFDAGLPKNITLLGNNAAARHPSVAYIDAAWKVVGGIRFATEMDSFAVSTSYNEPNGEPLADQISWRGPGAELVRLGTDGDQRRPRLPDGQGINAHCISPRSQRFRDRQNADRRHRRSRRALSHLSSSTTLAGYGERRSR